jgi:hypothetical protein
MDIIVKQVKDLKAGDDLVLKEQKTGKERRLTLNALCINPSSWFFRLAGPFLAGSHQNIQ